MISPSVKGFGGTQGTLNMRSVTNLGGTTGAQSDSTLVSSTDKAQAQPSSASSLPGTQNTSNGLSMANGYGPRKVNSKVIAEFFHKEPCLYGHDTFKVAGALYEALQHPPVDDPLALHNFEQKRRDSLPDIQFTTENEKRLVLNLVFSTLKYQRFLEDILEDCSFYSQYPEYRDDCSLVMVILCDYRQRKFQIRTPLRDEKPDPYLREIERALIKAKTKLNAAQARNRIKNNVASVDKLLPEAVREHEKHASKMHVCCWVNQLKTNMEAASEQLRAEGFIRTDNDVELQGNNFYVDRHCPDVLCFSAEQRHFFEGHPLVQEGHLVIQDKSSCVGVQSVRNLINAGDDILVVSGGSCLAAAHLASLAKGTDSTVYMAGVQSETLIKQVNLKLQSLNAKSKVHVMTVNFADIDAHDERFKNIKVILLMTECSRSAVTNPVDFIVTEGEDVGMLKDLSLGKLPDGRMGELNSKHTSILKHALKFSSAQAVVYVTRSMHKAENEAVIIRCVEFINMVQQKKMPWRVSPPVLPLSQKDIESENPLSGKYLIFQADYTSSGCFLAVITREAEDPKQAAMDILARARANGLVTGAPEPEKETTAKKKKKKEKVKTKRKEGTPSRTVSGPQKVVTAVKVAKAQSTNVPRTKSTPAKLPKTGSEAPTETMSAPRVATVEKQSPPQPRTASPQKHVPFSRRTSLDTKSPTRTANAEKRTADTEAGVKTPVSLSLQSFPPPSLSPTPRILSTTRVNLPPAGSNAPVRVQSHSPTRSLVTMFDGGSPTRHQTSSSHARPAPFRPTHILKQNFERRKQEQQDEELKEDKVTYKLFHMKDIGK